MVEIKHLTCIGCPMSCPLELTIIDGELREITGNECQRGEDYALQELTAPSRMVSTTVSCPSGLWPRLPVKTAEAIPKDKVIEAVRILHTLTVKAPIQAGQVILDNVAETGISVISTRSLPPGGKS